MRHALIIAAVAIGGIVSFLALDKPADAQERRVYPYCFVRYGPLGALGSYQCDFTSHAQCMATASGIGGQCEQNPEVIAQQMQKSRKATGRR